MFPRSLHYHFYYCPFLDIFQDMLLMLTMHYSVMDLLLKSTSFGFGFYSSNPSDLDADVYLSHDNC